MVDESRPAETSQAPAVAPGLEGLVAQVKQRPTPPVHDWNPPFCGDIDMRIARDGTWYYQGSPITRPAMVRLFSSVLRRDDDGKTYLVTPVEKLGIQVDDAPFLVVGLGRSGAGADQRLVFRTLTEDVVIADSDHPIWVDHHRPGGEPTPYLRIRDRLHGLINRPVFYDLVEIAVEERLDDGTYLGVWSEGSFFPLGRVDEAAA
ncbi:proteophosphoglycan precursor [Rhodothalassium salexigens]|uniref:DUF1285 domain-containing protein n=1 Tax=Rhodothalassium salexigens TaxID=1086 RepID=UPI0019137ADB|nr:DUF1285 domain-containing protein [Rhodothalassium salexigens]MBK5910828.1 proteophosphoglycan precursor [Rhodothalassium salexigens]MBK5919485.1 proteophosphoglycan precursor [Rhodothalassium salexigens]